MKKLSRGLVALTTLALAATGATVAATSEAEAAPYNGAPQLIADLNPGSGNFDITNTTPVLYKGKLYFSGGTGMDRELWATDGTTAGTAQVGVTADTFPSYPQQLTLMGGNLYFLGYTPSTGYELFVTDGTAVGTHIVKEIGAGSTSGPNTSPGSPTLVASGNLLFFAAYGGPTDNEPWVSDGTAAGTHQLADIAPYVPSGGTNVGSGPADFTALANGYVAFTAFDQSNASNGEVELYTSNGTGVNKVDINPTGSSSPRDITPFGNGALFAASGVGTDAQPSSKDVELWKINSPADVTGTLVKNINPNGSSPGSVPDSSSPQYFTTYKGKVYFQARTADNGAEIWSSDGTTAGTVQLPDVGLGPGVGNNLKARPAPLLGELYFGAGVAVTTTGEELYAWDGTNQRVIDAVPGSAGADPEDNPAFDRPGLVQVGNQIAFIGHQPEGNGYNDELWASDGTAAGTRKVAELNPAPQSAGAVVILGAVGNTLVFVGNDGQRGNELYSVDFTPPVAPPTPAPTTPTVPPAPGTPGGPAAKSTISLSVKKTYPLSKAAKRKIKVAIAVSAPGVLPTGTVTLSEKGKVVGTGALTGGVASVQITKKLKAGKHTLLATYGGSPAALTSTSTPVTLKVKGKAKPKKK